MDTETKRLPGRPKDHLLQERRREEILDRATGAFAEHGYADTDVRWIADGLGISKGTIYHYFPSKEELFLAAVRRGVQRMRDEITSAKDSMEDPIEKIRMAVLAYLRFFKSNPGLVELFIQERAAFKATRVPIYFEHRDARSGPFREMVRELIVQKRFRSIPVERIIDVLGDVLYGTMFTNHFAGRSKPFESQAEDILDVVFKGILGEGERTRE